MRILSTMIAAQLALACAGACATSGCTEGSPRAKTGGGVSGSRTETLAGTSTTTSTSTVTTTATTTETDTETDTETETDSGSGTETDTGTDTETATETSTETATDTGTATDAELEATSTGTVVDIDDPTDLAGFTETGLFRDIKRDGSSFSSVEVVVADDIRVAGHISTNSDNDGYMMAFSSDGAVDQEYARKGRWRYSFSGFTDDKLTAMVANSGGRIIVVAPEAPQGLISVRRTTGTFIKLATTAGASGYDPTAPVSWVINLDAGKVLVGRDDHIACVSLQGVLCSDFGTMGVSAVAPGTTAALAPNDAFVLADANSLRRYDPAGAPVTGYGTGGVSDTLPHSIKAIAFTQIVVESYVLGKTLDATDFNRVSRVDEMGHLDPTFGTGGTASVAVPNHPMMTLEFITLQDNVPVVCGTDDGAWICVRLTYQGILDASFGTEGDGVFSTEAVFDEGRLNAISHDSLDRLLLAGESAAPGNSVMRATLIRLTENGQFDAAP